MIDLYTLEKDAAYVVSRGFTDFHGNVFTPGEVLSYVERLFLPYHGGHTIVFKERKIYLQEEENKAFIDDLAQYLSRAKHVGVSSIMTSALPVKAQPPE